MSRRGVIRVQLENQVQAIAVLLRSTPEEILRQALEALVEKLDLSDRTLARALLERSSVPQPTKPMVARESRSRLCDVVRQFVIENCFEPAREVGRATVEVRPAEVHARLGLNQRYASVVGALELMKFHREQKVRLVESGLRLGEKVLLFEFEEQSSRDQE